MRRHGSNSTISRLGGNTRTGTGCSGFLSSSFRSPSWCWAVLRTLSPNLLSSFRSLVPVFCCFMSSACFFLCFLKKSIRRGAPSAAFVSPRLTPPYIPYDHSNLFAPIHHMSLEIYHKLTPILALMNGQAAACCQTASAQKRRNWDELQTPKQSQTLCCKRPNNRKLLTAIDDIIWDSFAAASVNSTTFSSWYWTTSDPFG